MDSGATVVLRRSVFATVRDDEARHFLDAAYGTSLRLSGAIEGAELRHERIDAGLFTVDRITLPGTLSFSCEPIDRLIVNDLRAGRLRVDRRDGDERAGAGDLVLNPLDVPYSAMTLGSTMTSLSLDPEALRQAAGLAPDEPLAPVGPSAGRVAPAAARVWRSCVDLVAEQLDGEPELPALVVSRAARLLGSAALAAFPAQAGPAPASRGPAGTATVRRAVAFIEANADQDVSLSQIAAAAHVTPRALQYAFRRHLDTTPLRYLRRVRLDAAHRDLLAADPGTTTVTRIAMRWGFAHSGQFAAHYRDAYAASPSSALQRRA